MRSLEELTGIALGEAADLRTRLPALALEQRNAAAVRAGKPAFGSIADWLADLSRRTVCLTLLAGAGSRWQKSLEAARALPPALRPAWFDPDFDPALPRGLYPVRDFLGTGGGPGAGRVPIATYSLRAVRSLGRHLVVVRGFEAEIDRGILGPLGLSPADRDFFTQAAPYGKPLGHGDAAWQCRALWRDSDYVIANFGGDANSRLSVVSALLVLDALGAAGAGVDLVIPAARIGSPAYPIGLDASGLPRSFGHNKLQGAKAGPAGGPGGADGQAYTNVGLRLYRAPALLAQVEAFRDRFWTEGTGYAIPGNDPAGHEFALDNVDAELARGGRARLLAACRPEELAPAKGLDDIPAFERAMESVVAGDREAGF